MPQILAANNLSIQIDDHSWSLFNGRGDGTQPIVRASAGGLAYQPAFASARRLPGEYLPVQDVAMVVVGWAVEDSSWHLGVLVTPEIAQTRGGRWCGLARWDATSGAEAEEAGKALAARLNKPLRLVPPVEPPVQPAAVEPLEQATIEAPDVPAELPTVPPMPLPISLGEWVVEEDLQGLLVKRSKAWRTRTTLYAVLSIVLAAIFGLLSVGAKLSPYAPVQPDWLPYIGMGIGALMLLIGLSYVAKLLRATSVLIDNRQRLVRLIRQSKRTILQSPYEGIEYTLVSHVLTRRESASKSKVDLVDYDRIWPEVWIHLYSPRRGFIPICYVSLTEGRMQPGLTFEERRLLKLAEIDTPAHHAAMHVAEMVGVPAYVEER